MQYQIEFLDDANTIVRMMHTIAESPAIAFRLVVERGWSPCALTAHVIDSYGQLTIFKPGRVQVLRPGARLVVQFQGRCCVLGLRGDKLSLNRFELAQPQRTQMGRPIDYEGDQLVAFALEDCDHAVEGLARRLDCGVG